MGYHSSTTAGLDGVHGLFDWITFSGVRSHLSKHLLEPRLLRVKGLAALDAREFTDTQLPTRILVHADHTAHSLAGAMNGEHGRLADELNVGRVRRRCARKIARLLNEHLFSLDHL